MRHVQGAGDRDEPKYPGDAQQAQEHMTWDINHFILVRNAEEDHFNGEIIDEQETFKNNYDKTFPKGEALQNSSPM